MIKDGLTSVLKIAHLAEAFAMQLEIHHGANSLNDVANLHVQMAIPNTSFVEVLLPREAWWHGLVEEIQIDSGGFANAPTPEESDRFNYSLSYPALSLTGSNCRG
jgi:L-alanine-DL-glutamate epimerase-like enolase superfamily enzyme